MVKRPQTSVASGAETHRGIVYRLPRGQTRTREGGSSRMEISKVAVIGCGLMGHGITQICAQAGWDVTVREVSQEKLDGCIGNIEKQLARAAEKGSASQEYADAVRGLFHTTVAYT